MVGLFQLNQREAFCPAFGEWGGFTGGGASWGIPWEASPFPRSDAGFGPERSSGAQWIGVREHGRLGLNLPR